MTINAEISALVNQLVDAKLTERDTEWETKMKNRDAEWEEKLEECKSEWQGKLDECKSELDSEKEERRWWISICLGYTDEVIVELEVQNTRLGKVEKGITKQEAVISFREVWTFWFSQRYPNPFNRQDDLKTLTVDDLLSREDRGEAMGPHWSMLVPIKLCLTDQKRTDDEKFHTAVRIWINEAVQEVHDGFNEDFDLFMDKPENRPINETEQLRVDAVKRFGSRIPMAALVILSKKRQFESALVDMNQIHQGRVPLGQVDTNASSPSINVREP